MDVSKFLALLIETRTIVVALTKSTPFEETKKVTHDYTMVGVKALSESNKTGKPLRFVYFSGALVDRDLIKEPTFMPGYCRMRVGLLRKLLDHADKRRPE